MTLEENVREVNSVLVAIKDKIVECGVEVAEGTHTRDYATKVKAVYDAGKKSEYDAFWDAIQQNGNRTDYDSGFRNWQIEKIEPKYPIRTASIAYMFYLCKNLTELPQFESVFSGGEFAGAFAAFNSCELLEEVNIDIIPRESASNTFINSTFNGCKKLRTIQKVVSLASFNWSTTFNNCISLEEVTIEGVIGQNGLNLQWSPKLSKASITNIINCLDTTTTGLTVTLSQTAVNNAFTSDEWAALTNTKTNWTISLV